MCRPPSTRRPTIPAFRRPAWPPEPNPAGLHQTQGGSACRCVVLSCTGTARNWANCLAYVRDDLAARERAHLRVARQAPGQQDTVHVHLPAGLFQPATRHLRRVSTRREAGWDEGYASPLIGDPSVPSPSLSATLTRPSRPMA
jgi:hypothetical protein